MVGRLGAVAGHAIVADVLAGGTNLVVISGVGFAWLRLKSDSPVAPVCARSATNSVTFAVAWALTR